MCSFQRTTPNLADRGFKPPSGEAGKIMSKRPAAAPAPRSEVVGVTGLEPVTLRLSSACSNQLSYTPIRARNPELSPAAREVGGAEETRTPDL